MEKVLLSVSDFVALTNQTLEYAYPTVAIEGEVAEYKVSQGKWVYFTLKDADSAVSCFMTLWQVRQPIENGMKVIVQGSPKLTKWGRFSVTVRAIKPSGEGAIKKSFEILKAKLEKEGLFAPERKRMLPRIPTHVGVISSTEAAGYADFIKILNDRWGGVNVEVAHVQVQGDAAPDQIIRALKHFNEQEVTPEVIVIVRGGGSADDLAAFNDEQLARAIAASRVPTLVGVGHEVDETLADMVADVRAATPTNAAQLLVPDRRDLIRSMRAQVASTIPLTTQAIEQMVQQVRGILADTAEGIDDRLARLLDKTTGYRSVLAQLNPQTVLNRGYALVRGEKTAGASIEIELAQVILKAKVDDVRQK